MFRVSFCECKLFRFNFKESVDYLNMFLWYLWFHIGRRINCSSCWLSSSRRRNLECTHMTSNIPVLGANFVCLFVCNERVRPWRKLLIVRKSNHDFLDRQKGSRRKSIIGLVQSIRSQSVIIIIFINQSTQNVF